MSHLEALGTFRNILRRLFRQVTFYVTGDGRCAETSPERVLSSMYYGSGAQHSRQRCLYTPAVTRDIVRHGDI